MASELHAAKERLCKEEGMVATLKAHVAQLQTEKQELVKERKLIAVRHMV